MKKLLFLFLICGVFWFFAPQILQLKSLNGQNASVSVATPIVGIASGKKNLQPPVPVIVGEVQQKDVPIYLNGLGTVQGFNTVVVRSRVDGHLEKVYFTEGQDVKAGDILAQIDSRPFQASLDQALAKKNQDEALLENAKLDLKRDLTLLYEKAGTAQKADTQQALVTQLDAALKADDAGITAARIQLEYTTLRSPIEGKTGLRIVDEGNVVRSGDLNGVVVVTQLRPICVLFTVSEQYLPKIQAQMLTGKLPVIALARDNSTQIEEGALTVVDNQIDTTTGTIRLKAVFKNESLSLWPGQFVNVRLRLSITVAATVVPAAVVQRGPIGAYAYVINADETVELRIIKVTQIEDGLAIVENGLVSGERVVVDGQYRLQPGSKVKILEGGVVGAKGECRDTSKH